jgi:hypothetical protein
MARGRHPLDTRAVYVHITSNICCDALETTDTDTEAFNRDDRLRGDSGDAAGEEEEQRAQPNSWPKSTDHAPLELHVIMKIFLPSIYLRIVRHFAQDYLIIIAALVYRNDYVSTNLP